MDGTTFASEADVLIIGGGFAGCWAALRAADLKRDRHARRQGLCQPQRRIDDVGRHHDLSAGQRRSRHLGGRIHRPRQLHVRPALDLSAAGRSARTHQGLHRAGTSRSRATPTGAIRRFASRGMVNVRGMQYQPKVAMRELRRQITARGARSWIACSSPSCSPPTAHWPTKAGSPALSASTSTPGDFVVIKAKRTIIATGMIAMKGTHRVDNDCGDGVAMAFRAGGRLVDMEFTFGGTFNVLMKKFDFPSYNVAVAHGARLINARGERFMEKYDPVSASSVASSPTWLPLSPSRSSTEKGRSMSIFAMSTRATGPTSPSFTVAARSCSPNTFPIHAPIRCRSSRPGACGRAAAAACRSTSARAPIVHGLLAAGSVAKNDATGTHASAGSPTAFCKVSGWHAGECAARESREDQLPSVSAEVLLMNSGASPSRPSTEHLAASAPTTCTTTSPASRRASSTA